MAAQRALYYLRGLETLSMWFKLSTLIRSESQSEKDSGRVRVGGDACLLPTLSLFQSSSLWTWLDKS